MNKLVTSYQQARTLGELRNCSYQTVALSCKQKFIIFRGETNYCDGNLCKRCNAETARFKRYPALVYFQIFCSVIAGFLHYFFLVSFAWMCIEGVQLYYMLIKVFEADKSHILWFYLSAYGTFYYCHL